MSGSGSIAPPFLTSALEGDEWSALRPSRFTPWERAPVEPWASSLYPVAIPTELS
jgi:hypothetical protein